MNRRLARSVLVHSLLAIFVLFFLSPFVWMFITSFQPQENLTHVPPTITFNKWYVNYLNLLQDGKFLLALKNTLIITVFSSLLTIVFASCAAYALSRYEFKGKTLSMFSVYMIQMGPVVVFLIPIFLIVNRFGLIDTQEALIIVLTAFTIPVSMWILLGFFKGIPREMEEAGFIDGCKRFEVFWRIVLPMARPGFISAGIITFIMAWGELMLALPLTFSKAMPLTVYSTSFSGVYYMNYGGAAAVAIISSLPIIVIVLVFRDYLLKGLVEGAVKG